LRIQLLNGFALDGADGRPVALPAPRQQELLAYLLLHRETPQPREQIAFLLWPETTDSQARSNLRRELFRLRNQWPAVEGRLAVDSQSLHWRGDGDLALDVADFEESLEAARLAQAAGNPDAEIAALQRAADA